jgi:hypothetical protein
MRIAKLSIATVALLMLSMFSVGANAQSRCSAATVKGKYVTWFKSDNVPLVAIGMSTFDGQGVSVQASPDVGLLGKYYPGTGAPVTVPYSLDADCTASLVDNSTTPPAHGFETVYEGGARSETDFVTGAVDAAGLTLILQLSALRMPVTQCTSPRALRGAYAVVGEDLYAPLGPDEVLGSARFDDRGGFSAALNVRRERAFTNVKLNGTYSLNADCTFTTNSLDDLGQIVTTYGVAVLNGDRTELHVIRTDPGTTGQMTLHKRSD